MNNDVKLVTGAFVALGIEDIDINDLLAIAVNEDSKQLILVTRTKNISLDLNSESKNFYKIVSPYLHFKAQRAVE